MPPLTLLNVGRWERLWRDLALLFFVGKRFDELSEDNSSSNVVSMLSETMGFFPLLRAVGCFAWLLSCTSFSPRSCLFSTWVYKRLFSSCRCSTRSCNSLICLTCSSCFCDALKPGGPLTTRQPAEYKWRSGYPTPL